MLIELNNIGYEYSPKTVFSKVALSSVNLQIDAGDYVAVVGPTGSGKSTLAQLISGLIMPTSGLYRYDDLVLNCDRLSKQNAGSFADIVAGHEIGMVFQFPETQLFEETVEKDVAFGPKNLGLKEDEIEERVKDSLARVGFDYETIAQRSPLRLSGGEKRLVAIAGVLAMRPKVLVLDEPTSGLDASGKDLVMGIIAELNKSGAAIVLVTHDMDDVSEYAKRLVVLDKGRIVIDGETSIVFADSGMLLKLDELGLGIPVAVQVLQGLKELGIATELNSFKMSEVVDGIKNIYNHVHSQRIAKRGTPNE